MATALGGLAIVALIAANALFVFAEFALTSVDRARLTRLARGGDRRAAGALGAISDLSFQLSGAQLGITVSSLLLGFITGPVLAGTFAHPFHVVGLGPPAARAAGALAALLAVTGTQMLLGELVPQNLAIARPLPAVLRIWPVQRAFSSAARPLIAAFDNTASAIVRALGAQPQEELRAARTPAELHSLISSSAEAGALADDVAGLLRRVLAFDAKRAGDVLTPRVRVVSARVDQTVAELLELARGSGHSRFPVHTGDLDDVAGLVHVKHAFTVPPELRHHTRIGQIMIEPVRVPESLHCDELLTVLRRRGLQLAVVADEYGGTAGVVTLEDLVEELVGEVRDEHDPAETPPVQPVGEGAWSVSGLLRRDEFDTVGLPAPPGPYETLAGLVLDRLGRVPHVGERTYVDGWRLEVTRMDRHRIDRVMVARPTPPPRGGRQHRNSRPRGSGQDGSTSASHPGTPPAGRSWREPG
ncbi:MAG TPA: hemolysin family protein [Mycobacteriales bacterium]|nr:hemolysin family protein [Mycobacteriales bacterium]